MKFLIKHPESESEFVVYFETEDEFHKWYNEHNDGCLSYDILEPIDEELWVCSEHCPIFDKVKDKCLSGNPDCEDMVNI